MAPRGARVVFGPDVTPHVARGQEVALHQPSNRQHIVHEIEPAGGVSDERPGTARAAESSEKRDVEVDVERRLPGRHRSIVDGVEPRLFEASERRDGHAELRRQDAERFPGESPSRAVFSASVSTPTKLEATS